MIKRTFDIGWIRVLELLMLLNVYLGLFEHASSLPALDGGRLVFLGYVWRPNAAPTPKSKPPCRLMVASWRSWS